MSDRVARSDPGAMEALLAANRRAAFIGMEDGPPTVVRGAPSHALAWLLQALEESGWKLVRHG